jgi:hypothetical protein
LRGRIVVAKDEQKVKRTSYYWGGIVKRRSNYNSG